MHPDPNREAFLTMIESQPLLGGRFTSIKRLGGDGGPGHFSLMFGALDTKSARNIALKVFHPGRADLYRIESFHREESLLRRFIGQADIIQLVAPMGEHQESVQTTTGMSIGFSFKYYALELARADLGQLLLDSSLGIVARLVAFREACRGIQRLHANRIAHRDIKPPNFLVMPDGTLRVSDLGTARDMRSSVPAVLQDYGMFWPGDKRYAPPEMLAGLFSESQELAFGADFYGLGASLFELFAGTALFSYVFTQSFVTDLTTAMHHVPPGRRRATFDAFVAAVATGHALPDLAAVNPDVPACLRDRLNELYQDLCQIDYRRRLTSFPVIFRRIQSCILCFQNEVRSRERADRRKLRRRVESRLSAGVLRR